MARAGCQFERGPQPGCGRQTGVCLGRRSKETDVYIPSDNGMLTCLDAKTSELKYEGKRLSKTGPVTAAPVAIDGKILLMNEDGDTFVIQSGLEHRELQVNSIGEPDASLAVAGNSIY